jgi:hypothetical protein
MFIKTSLIILALVLSACAGKDTPSTGGLSSSGGSSSSSSGISAAEIKKYFAHHACGVGFSGLGRDDCYRTPEGGASCVISSFGSGVKPEIIVWSDTELPVRDVLHATSGRSAKPFSVAIVTQAGQAFRGSWGKIDPTPVINSGVISTSSGYFLMCALVKNKDKKDIVCDSSDGQFKRPEGLPEHFDAAQLIAFAGDACALDTEGKVWCWPENSAAKAVDLGGPVKAIAAAGYAEMSLCGLKFDGSVKCADNHNNWQPKNVAANIQKIFYADGLIVIDADGNASRHTGNTAQPVPIKNIIAAENSAFLTQEGDLFSSSNNTKIPNAKAQTAQCPW